MKLALKISIALGAVFLLGSTLLCFTELWMVGALGVIFNAVLLVLNIRKLRAL